MGKRHGLEQADASLQNYFQKGFKKRQGFEDIYAVKLRSVTFNFSFVTVT